MTTPHSEYEFCKGFYSRYTTKMYGRATRLFFTPFIRALEKILGYLPFLVYMDSFRYALAGEIAMRRDLAMALRIPSDWGLEVGTLAEVYRNVAANRICQVDIAETYEHKHQPLTLKDPNKGLLKMGTDIAKTIFRTMASRGYTLTKEFFISLKASYLRIAQDLIARYEYDSIINGLQFDRHKEGSSAEAFTLCIMSAGEQFIETPIEVPYIPNWNRVISAVPNIFELLIQAVEEDDAD